MFENEGLRLPVSEDMRDAVIVKTDEAGRIFSVYEKASVEAAERLRAAEAGTDPGNTGEGWLFGIELVNEAQLHEMLCSDMSGADVFARTADGGAYLYLHPTDVRMVRDGDDAYGQQDRAAWAAATEWAAGMPGRLVEENALTAYRRSNTELDMVLARILYRGDVHYELTSLAHGTFTPNAAEAAPCMEALADLTYEYADASQTPDGEYIVMNLPDEDTRFDFFLGGDGSYVRKVRGDYEELYRAEGGADVISPVRALYDSLAAAAGKADYDYEAYNAAMQSVLDEYAALDAAALENYDESAHPELPWYTAAIANTVRNDLYYGVYDFDGNDVPELIIAAGDDTAQVPEAVYAFDGAKMVYLFKEHPMGERAYLTWNGELFATHGAKPHPPRRPRRERVWTALRSLRSSAASRTNPPLPSCIWTVWRRRSWTRAMIICSYGRGPAASTSPATTTCIPKSGISTGRVSRSTAGATKAWCVPPGGASEETPSR